MDWRRMARVLHGPLLYSGISVLGVVVIVTASTPVPSSSSRVFAFAGLTVAGVLLVGWLATYVTLVNVTGGTAAATDLLRLQGAFDITTWWRDAPVRVRALFALGLVLLGAGGIAARITHDTIGLLLLLPGLVGVCWVILIARAARLMDGPRRK